MTDTRKCYTANGVALRTGMSVQHIHRLTKNNVLNFEEGEFDVKEGKIVIYSDTALEKFLAYSQENHRGRKKKEETETELQLLDKYCELNNMSKSEVLKESIKPIINPTSESE